MRKRFIQRNGVLVEVGADYVPEPRSSMIMPDIKPYRSMADGSLITSRSKHREHLRAHGCVEIGNETKHLRPQPMQSPPGLKESIIRATNEVLSKRR